MTRMRYRCVGNDAPCWQQGSHPQRIEHEAVMRQTLDYIRWTTSTTTR